MGLAAKAGGDLDLSKEQGGAGRGAPQTDRGVHHSAPAEGGSACGATARCGGVQGDGGDARHPPRRYWWDQAIDWDLAEDEAERRATRIALCRAAATAAREEPGPGPPNTTAPPGSVRGPIMGTGLYVNPFAAPATTTAAEGGRVITPLQRDIAPIPDAAEAEGGPPRTMIGHRCPVSRGG